MSFFDRVTHPEAEQSHIDAMLQMIYLFDKQQKGQITEGKQMFQQYLLDKFALPAAEYKKKYPNNQIRNVSSIAK